MRAHAWVGALIFVFVFVIVDRAEANILMHLAAKAEVADDACSVLISNLADYIHVPRAFAKNGVYQGAARSDVLRHAVYEFEEKRLAGLKRDWARCQFMRRYIMPDHRVVILPEVDTISTPYDGRFAAPYINNFKGRINFSAWDQRFVAEMRVKTNNGDTPYFQAWSVRGNKIFIAEFDCVSGQSSLPVSGPPQREGEGGNGAGRESGQNFRAGAEDQVNTGNDQSIVKGLCIVAGAWAIIIGIVVACEAASDKR